MEVFAYAGNDTVTVNKGSNHKIYAGAGKDKITVTKNAKTGITVYGDASKYDYYTNGYTKKGDKDTITVNGGKSIGVYGEAGNDAITVNKGTNLHISGGAGTDTIKVYGGSGHTIYGDYSNNYMSGQKKDNIYIYGGSFDKIDGGGGADKISVSKKAKGGASSDDTATIYGGAGGDTITVSVGTNYNISGDAGADKITLKGSKTYAQVNGDDGNDTLTVNSSNNTRIDGGADNDTITVTGGTDNGIFAQKGNNTIIATSLKSSGGYFSSANITCGSGHDTITLTKCNGYKVDPGAGANKITIDGGQNNTISYSSTDSITDTIEIKGGTGHVVANSLGGKVTVSGSGTTCDITIGTGDGSATLQAGSKTVLNFNYYNSGKFTINAVKGTLANDMITFKNNSSKQFAFGHDGSALTLTGNGAGSLRINNFINGAFAGGIQFSDSSTPMSYDTIKAKAWQS